MTPAVNAWNAEYLEAAYQQFQADPQSVSPDLQAFFRGFELGLNTIPAAGGAGALPPGAGADGGSSFQAAVDDLIFAYREFGHLAAKIDPFGRERTRPPELGLAHHGLKESDLDRVVHTGTLKLPDNATLREVIRLLDDTYCRSIGYEIMHAQTSEERTWLLDRIESARGQPPLSHDARIRVLHQLLQAEEFEKFLGKRYPSDKRFSLEGSESTIPLLNRLMERATELGVEEMVVGMAHRGRLNVLNNIMGKSYEQIFTEFEDNSPEAWANDGGDVKYHRGYSGQRRFPSGKTLHVSMASNPSHLESVDGVVEGRTRAKQRLRGDLQRTRVVPLLIHGDAALPAQGVVAETLNLAYLDGYTTGGTVHAVINNLVGFTTSPEDGRSTTYCTDIAKMILAPVFHVNGEDPEAVIWTAQLAIDFRQQFKRDIFIDLYCYRKYGHNEQDEASYTQPILYSLIRKKSSVLKVYAERLLAEGVINEADMVEIRRRLDEALEAAQAAAKQTPYDPTIDPGSARWQGMGGRYTHDPANTAVPVQMLQEVCAALGRTPEGFRLNPKLKNLLEARANLPQTKLISYADAESLAYGTLLLEGTAVRVSGQDVRRGTFSHRHAVLRDTETGEPYIPLNHMRELGRPGTDAPPGSTGPDGRQRQAQFCIHDSPLSEYAVLGFEYGYSLADPNMLVCWEAQFGDFNNGAQIIIDQYLASAEAKWERWSGLVMLLPHGYEGAGPEHSSARLERFLTLCGNDNMQVVHPTTAPQMFHLLRRQVRRNFRKPLILMTPKSLLRTPTGTIDELVTGRFQEMLDDHAFSKEKGWDRAGVKRLLLCSGKIYFELAERREKLGRKDTAIIRIEQLYPFNKALLAGILAAYPKAAKATWVQEEPRNAGAFLFISDLLRTQLGLEADYIGREGSATPATGSKHAHKAQQEHILTTALGALPEGKEGGKAKPPAPAKQPAPAR
ncbi:MAG: 2-oxoglutarate dehydrogenase E1 component [Phycisphaerales bacterium]